MERELKSIPAEYQELTSLSLAELTVCYKIQKARDPYSQGRSKLWPAYHDSLTPLQQRAEYLLYQAEKSTDVNSKSRQIVDMLWFAARQAEAAKLRRRAATISVSLASNPYALLKCDFHTEREKKVWAYYVKLRQSPEGKDLADRVSEWGEFWYKVRGYSHVTPGMLVDPVREDPNYVGLKGTKKKIPNVIVAGLLRDLTEEGRLPKGFVTFNQSFFDRMARIIPDKEADKRLEIEMADADRGDLFK